MSALFPIFLKLQGRRVVVIGAGRIAEQKLDGLLQSGASVRVIAPEAAAAIRELANEHRLVWSRKRFEPEDLDGAALVVAATSDRGLNAAVYAEAERRGILCNAVDQPELCHFYYPSVVRRGDLQVAISTAGKSPALAQRLRKQLEQWLVAEYEPWLNWLGTVRAAFFERKVPTPVRVRTLHQMASSQVFERFVRSRQRRAS